ncbi:Crp/Fnr family transcriptional regulator [Arthrobacter sp. TPD3018]|uniref:Crp/Fnr family transcriptional regulator n=1 Tax=Bacteria TaxID=2 RepID=UPI000D51F743|nr:MULTISPECIES: Crp/Fnr family transcriptional regulator [Bacteria]PVE50227.1 Crp/Fnr family transcriptional regulator [Sphingomonas sp. TPD3009]PVE51033.1 Crp/Fnr family transcriptional regulator [Arthrobacter sp. TPD3018]PVE80000.1 Crp/Fnr family transcriptional regulator [Sphingomonas melonis]
MIERHFAKLRARGPLTDEEEQAIRNAVVEVRRHPADAMIVRAYDTQDHSTLLLDGILCRYKDLRNGQRQITELHVAGDFADLHSFTLKYLDHDVMSLTPCQVAVVPHDALRSMTERLPSLARQYWFSTNLDAAIHREWELSLGRRTAFARVAALISELHQRLLLVGLATETGYDLPLTQTDLAECLGLTNVSVNRVLRDLRDGRLARFGQGRVTILDRTGLWQAAEFDPRYLYLGYRA